MTLKELIHDTVMDIFEAGIFRKVKYVQPSGGQLYARMTVTSEMLKPLSCEANEATVSIESPRDRQVGDGRREMREQSWEAHAAFGFEIEAGTFLNSFSRLILSTADTPCFLLELKEAEFVHPPRKDPSSGTYMRLSITAKLNPT